ncbi:Toluene transporter subunit: membrane component of ABC superfamily [Magnetospirillum sp. LM-5]|uniref:MlaC/ttg2D family ABC transporter substrate-binding protein n=1 Tax=Magnetospirillum sp. LM-5 TaxID=2681466 RepID=UPI001385AC9A|nr:ABC transporter substrate-binding protein [Magnetospirillum sp. LM-5]CAA7616819.1 Toluene transporter subunit: membrane component of ABC superfamily [Magnetospirillum sp. LM-5]
MLSRRHLLAAIVSTFALVSSPVSAFADPAATDFIVKLADTAMTTVAAKGLSDDERTKRFRTLFVDNFDIPEIGKLVLGRYWRVATPEQQKDFVGLFEDIQVYTWARRFKDYSGETLEVLAIANENDGDLQVESRIKRDKLDPINVGWRVRKAGATYRVLDIKVEGASMAQTHRAEYSSVIQANGGTVDGLLAAMRKKITQLQAESKTN